MNVLPAQSYTHNVNTVSNCCKNETVSSDWLKHIDLICRIAIGVFGAIIAPLPFLISLNIGLLAGAAYAATRYIQNKTLFPEGQSKPVCAQGYMDFLSGMRFPPVIGTIATATFIGAHMRHDPQFYVPFCGVFLGFWIGRECATAAKDLAGRIFSRIEAPKPATALKEAPSCCHQTA